MDQDLAVWIIGGLLSLLAALVALLYRQIRGDIKAIRAQLDTAESLSAKLDSFLSRDAERETQWYRWREDLENRLREWRKTDADWRHDKLAPMLTVLQASSYRVEEQLRHIEKTMNAKP